MKDLLNLVSFSLGIDYWLLVFILFTIYISPTILAIHYWVFNFWFIIVNLFLGRSPIPRVILIIKAIKNKNLFRDESEKKLNLRFSKKELEEFKKMKKDRDERLNKNL